ncbi:heterodimeric methylmalonyl-CoA mutase small subunit [Fulvimarina manganoxydans]|uniref:Heterodimeric methylmalonyl-CoA mutase small subunit n=1 Tax=Fulvimarina manganoxydans TaxID=937218 RepID=A0A1W2EQ22_9HYPH|nr:methylmalonyl-CoA mutase family protein [Fulvimarina manganoxydans]SMD11813.1 heterodimeric methylmalonyl-CoA mutase small subunit [Fulvimarina manganoxydans]
MSLETTFDRQDESDWREAVVKGLKGKAFESLVTEAEDGFTYGPLHGHVGDAKAIARRDESPWRILQAIDDIDPSRANIQALADLEGGANGLALAFAGAPAALGFGLPVAEDALSQTLTGVMTDIVSLRLEPHPRTLDLALMLASRLGARRQDAPPIDLGYDPIAIGATAGRFPLEDRDPLDALSADLGRLMDLRLAGSIAEADGRVFHDAGASPAEEIGAVLAITLTHLKAFDRLGIDPAEASERIGLTLAADQRQFITLAKFRAMRLCHAKLLEALGAEAPPPPRIHGTSSYRMMSALDPHANLLRLTIAAFAAACGRADSLTLHPHTAPLGLTNAHARRLSRNLQLLLQEETGLDRPIDPAAGSGAIEHLTDHLAQAGWEAFRRIEAEGGIVESLKTGALQSRIAASHKGRQEAVDKGAELIIGATKYPMAAERDHGLLVKRSAPLTSRDGDIAFEPLVPVRLSETVEQSR